MHLDPALPPVVAGLFAVIAAVVVLKLFRQPSIIAFLLAGVVIGPHGLGRVSDAEVVHKLESFGVLFLLFFVGMEVVPERRKTVEELCHEEWFELMRGGPDQASLLRLTFDHSRPSSDSKPAKHRARSKAQTLRASSAALAVAAAAPAPSPAKPPFIRKVTPPPDAILEAAPPPREGRVVSPQPRGSLG